jgi:hypothetical protein
VIYDLLVTLVGRAVVVHPAKVKLIAEARVKTDNVDVLTLAQLLRADMLPEVWVPPSHVRDLRAQLSHRRLATIEELLAVRPELRGSPNAV